MDGRKTEQIQFWSRKTTSMNWLCIPPIWGTNQIIGRFTTSPWFISFVTKGNRWIHDVSLPGMSRESFYWWKRTNTSKYSVTMCPQLSFHKNEHQQNSKFPINVLIGQTKALGSSNHTRVPIVISNSRETAESVPTLWVIAPMPGAFHWTRWGGAISVFNVRSN